ncbi:MAG: hypothetical protein KGV44_14805 [Flavobacteriaceae bacterium]|nr:hypothetical protein [Flavobacteriaceae bacterium]
MKKISLLVFVSILMTSCLKESESGKESEFLVNCHLKFVFLNEKGENIIDVDNIKSLPVTHQSDKNFKELKKEEFRLFKGKEFYYRMNRISYDESIKGYYWGTGLFGFDNAKEGKTFVYINGADGDDVIKMKFTSSHEGCIGAYYCCDTHEIYYNNTLIYSDGKYSEKLDPKYVYIKKKKDNSTEVILEK